MAQPIDADSGLLVSLGGWAVALIIALFTFLTNWRKGGVEETAVVLGKWKELVEAHESQIDGMRSEIATLKQQVRELEKAVEAKSQRIDELQRELDGERRQSAQREQSFREQLKLLGHNNEGGRLDGPTKRKR